MALNKTTTSIYGHEIINAYHRVENINVIKKQFISFNVNSYKDILFAPFNHENYSCAYDITGENPIKQAYEYLKTLSEFANATDC